MVDVFLIIAVNVERQRLRSSRDVVDDIIEILVGQDGYDRSENLLLHDQHVRRDIREHGGMYRAVGGFENATHSSFGTLAHGIVEESLDSGKVLVVHNLGDACLVDAPVFAVEVFRHSGSKLLDQGILLLLLDEYIVGTDTGLP